MIPCAERGCPAKFHPLCGKDYGGSAHRGPQIPTKCWTARCPAHAWVAVEAAGAGARVRTGARARVGVGADGSKKKRGKNNPK